jgi:hypothetical protein
MKLIRFLVILITLLLVAVCGIWFYATKHIAAEINAKYAGKKFEVQGIDKSEYFIIFDKVSPTGFPFKISWNIEGWSEESRTAKIRYTSPVQVGYDLLLQQIFVSYDGEIISAYKPEKNGFGSRLKIDDYQIKAGLPLTVGLFETLKNMKDPASLINHLGNITIASGRVEVFDLVDNEKFYDKEFERFDLAFVPQKKYESVDDLLSHIPQYYKADYRVKIMPTDAKPRRMPVSLFYGFSMLPSGVDIKANAVIKTKGNDFQEIGRGLDVKAEIACESSTFKLRNLKLDYKASDESQLVRDYQIETSSKLHTKTGMFDQLFARYKDMRAQVLASSMGKLIDHEILYIIAHKDDFKFKELENSDYDFHLKMESTKDKGKAYTKIDDFSIFSEDSGIKLQHNMETIGGSWDANGLLYVKNYPAVIDFTSAYVYRFGKYRFLSEEARKLYVDVNTEFFKSISDHPDSASNDLSFEYKINSNNLNKAKFGSVRIDQVAQIYSLMLYKKLFGKVGADGDVLSRMRKIIPDINPNDPLLQQILPKISKGNLEKSAQEQIKKLVPSEAKDAINKIIPKDAFKKEKLLKDLFK